MKKIILTTLISFGLAFAANAQKKGQNNGHSNNKSSHQSKQKVQQVQKNHKPQYSNNHRDHNSHSANHTNQRVWVAGVSQRVWVPPRYEYVRKPCGTLVRVCVSHGYYNTVQTPGYYTYKKVPVRHGHHASGLSISWRF
ncbi:MAG: hypothetical protein NE328_17050 [Lentisphaeraceae bacterium]|nr:hypothetical protein [Lentisphaeraceae bacterium]